MSAIGDLKTRKDLGPLEYAVVHYAIFGGEQHTDRAENAAAELAQLRATVEDISAVELAAYRYYLGADDTELTNLFEDMLADERERYGAAYDAVK